MLTNGNFDIYIYKCEQQKIHTMSKYIFKYSIDLLSMHRRESNVQGTYPSSHCISQPGGVSIPLPSAPGPWKKKPAYIYAFEKFPEGKQDKMFWEPPTFYDKCSILCL